MKKRIPVLALTLLLVLSLAVTAFAAKARSVEAGESSASHANHLLTHLYEPSCRCTGNYVKVRTTIGGSDLVGHLEQADTFLLLDVNGAWARVRVLKAAQTSPDSRVGMEGWVDADYIDCPCESGAVAATGVFPAGTPMSWLYTSGAGAWDTELYLQPDGTFYGFFHDSDMGSSGEGYPNGTEYECDFSGRFGNVTQLSPLEYGMTVAELSISENTQRDYIENGVLHVASEPYGLCAGDEFRLYLPATPKAALSDECLSWLFDLDENTLGKYALCNLTEQLSFNQN